MNKSFITTIAIIILGVLAGGCSLLPKQKNESSPETNQQPVSQNQNPENQGREIIKDSKYLIDGNYTYEIINTTDWKIYKNNKFGFELKYPADWKIDSEASDEGEEYSAIIFAHNNAKDVPEGLKEGSISLYVSNDQRREPLNVKLNRLKKSENIHIWKVESDIYNGYYYDGFDEGLVMSRNNIYDFSILSSLTPEKSKENDEVRSVLNGMIQSVRFYD